MEIVLQIGSCYLSLLWSQGVCKKSQLKNKIMIQVDLEILFWILFLVQLIEIDWFVSEFHYRLRCCYVLRVWRHWRLVWVRLQFLWFCSKRLAPRRADLVLYSYRFLISFLQAWFSISYPIWFVRLRRSNFSLRFCSKVDTFSFRLDW